MRPQRERGEANKGRVTVQSLRNHLTASVCRKDGRGHRETVFFVLFAFLFTFRISGPVGGAVRPLERLQEGRRLRLHGKQAPATEGMLAQR